MERKGLVTLEGIKEAERILQQQPSLIVRTPLLDLSPLCPVLSSTNLPPRIYFKLESLQTTGSFKIRGVLNQIRKFPKNVPGGVTMSAGNYGKAFAFMSAKLNISAMVCLPETAPPERAEMLKKLGAQVEKVPTSQLMQRVAFYEKEKGLHFAHPFDDLDLIAGYGTCGLEILQDLPDVDVVVVPCGGGGLLSGISAALKLSGSKAKIVGVEPRGAPKMFESKKAGRALSMEPKTIATGLAPPFAGKNTFEHVKAFVDELVLVSDEEIIACVKILSKSGLVVEPSGAAAFAAIHSGKIGNLAGKKVVCIASGSNISSSDLAKL